MYTYQLSVGNPEGTDFTLDIQHSSKYSETDFQTIPEPVGIANVYAKVETQATENTYYSLYGYQFYLNTQEAKSDTNYFMWRLYGTYKYRSDFLIRYIWDGKLKPFPKPDSLYTCYNDDNIDNLITMSTVGLSSPIIIGLPLNYVNTETRKLSIRYSLLVKQFSLNKTAFEYYDRVSTVNSDQEALYTKQPYQVRGNIYNTADHDELVLGYFLVGGVSEKRIYVDRSTFIEYHYMECVLTRRDYEAFGYIGWTDRVTWPLFVTTNSDGVRALPLQACMDCREAGGTPVVPDYWED